MGNQKTAENDSELLLTVDEVASKLRRGVRTIWRLDKKKLLPEARRIGHAKFWLRTELDLWIELGCPERKEFNTIVKQERKKHGKAIQGDG